MILPHKLVPWLQRQHSWSDVGEHRLREYWDHIKSVQLPFSGMSTGKHHPLFLWGDSAVFNKNREKLIVIVAGHLLDERTCSFETSWPLAVLREETYQSIMLCLMVNQVFNVKKIEVEQVETRSKELSIGFPTLHALLHPAPGFLYCFVCLKDQTRLTY